jgi:predicted HicB family RNase H-like nuclease
MQRYRAARADMVHLSLLIEPKLHSRLKRLAKRTDMTLKDFVISVLEGAK